MTRIVAFCCSYCGYSSADLAGRERRDYSPDVMIIRLPCTGRIDVVHLLRAFRHGADGVMVVGCLEGNCHFTNGNLEARKRVDQARSILRSVGLEEERVEMYNLASNQGWRFPEIVEEMRARVEELGPTPIKEVLE